MRVASWAVWKNPHWLCQMNDFHVHFVFVKGSGDTGVVMCWFLIPPVRGGELDMTTCFSFLVTVRAAAPCGVGAHTVPDGGADHCYVDSAVFVCPSRCGRTVSATVPLNSTVELRSRR